MDDFYAQEECAVARLAINLKSNVLKSADQIVESSGNSTSDTMIY